MMTKLVTQQYEVRCELLMGTAAQSLLTQTWRLPDFSCNIEWCCIEWCVAQKLQQLHAKLAMQSEAC